MASPRLCRRFILGLLTGSLLVASSSPWLAAQVDHPLYLPLIQTLLTVTTSQDELNTDGDCSLREAIQAANTDSAVDQCQSGVGVATILLPTGSYTLTLAGAQEDNNLTGDLDITGTLTLSGTGMGDAIIDGNQLDRVLHIQGNSHVTLHHLTIVNGKTPDGAANPSGSGEDAEAGGGIANAGTLTLIASVVTGNHTGRGGDGPETPMFERGGHGGGGGGLYNEGVLLLNHSHILQNVTGDGGFNGRRACPVSQGGAGGGVLNGTNGVMTLLNSTVSHNRTGIGGSCGDLSGGPGSGVVGGDGAPGAGLANLGTLMLSNSVVDGNVAGNGGNGGPRCCGGGGGSGGGIWNGGTLTVQNSTISGNHAGHGGSSPVLGNAPGGDGGGIANVGVMTLENTTIRGNAAGGYGGVGAPALAAGFGGGLYTETKASLRNTLIAGNLTFNVGADCTGLLKSYSHNLIQDTTTCILTYNISRNLYGVDPLLGALLDNGGPTRTHALLPGSPALNTGDCYTSAGEPVLIDQRGVPRPQGDGCDIGAFEAQPP